MIQLSIQPPTGIVPGVRAAGFPLGTASDFALAFADLAMAVAPPVAAFDGSMTGSAAPVAMRQPVAGDGMDLPLIGTADGLSTISPEVTDALTVRPQPFQLTVANPSLSPAEVTVAGVAMPGAAIPVAAVADTDITIAEPVEIAGSPAGQASGRNVAVDLGRGAEGGAAAGIGRLSEEAADDMSRDSVSADLRTASKEASDAPKPAINQTATPPSTDPSIQPSLDPSIPPPIAMVALVPVAVEAVPAPAGVRRVSAPVVTNPGLGPVVGIATPEATTPDVLAAPADPYPKSATIQPQRSAAPARTRAALGTPAAIVATMPSTPASAPAGPPAIGAPASALQPSTPLTPASAAAGPPAAGAVASTPRPSMAPAAGPGPGVSAAPPPAPASMRLPTPLPTPASDPAVAIVAPRFSRMIDAAPSAATVETPAAIPQPAAPATRLATAPDSRTVVTAATAPAATPITAPSPVPTPAPAPAAADIGSEVRSERSAPVTVTVFALPASPVPVIQAQPAAQAFAAAMFAAGEPLDVRSDDAIDDLPFGISAPSVSAASQQLAVAVSAPGAAQQPTLDMAGDDWMASMIDRIETLRDDGGGIRETRMKLAPEALGTVEVSVRRDEQGALQVRIAADTPQARALLAEAAPKLAEMAEARGVKLGGASVDSNTGSADQGKRDAPVPVVQRRPAAAAADGDTDPTDSRLA